MGVNTHSIDKRGMNIMFGLGATELIIILVIVLVIFGAGKLPKVMKDLGKGVKSFKEAMSGEESPEDPISPPTTIQGETKKRIPNPKIKRRATETSCWEWVG